jgi:hypothetical protein
MPGFDGTGPRGMGPMTGGGRGFCAAPLGAVPRTVMPGQPAIAPTAVNPPVAPWNPWLAACGWQPGPWVFGRGMGWGCGRGRGGGRGWGW